MKNTRFRITTILIIAILVIFEFIPHFDTNLFKNDIKYTFNEAVERQIGEGTLNTKERWKVCQCERKDVEQAMSISHGDNPLKYMDISEKVPMSESEVNHILKGKGILEDQGHTFIKAQDKYEVNIIYLISHALVETGNGKSELAKGVKDGSHRYYNFYGIGAFDENAVHTGKSYAKQQS